MHNKFTKVLGPTGKIIGRVDREARTFVKKIRFSRHALRKPPALAIDADALDQAEQAGAVLVRVIDRESGTTFAATIQHIRAKGFELDRGFGRQIALPLSGWAITRRGSIPAMQLRLWREGAA